MSERILWCITVYNGRAFVPRALNSASRLAGEGIEVDFLILDDCSPDPGWSDELRSLCADHGFEYYRSPRNLGIPRNVNLALRTATARDYDYVVISNSDVVYPVNAVDALVDAARAGGADVGSVTAWSNNVSVYSLPNDNPDLHLADQNAVDWISETLSEHFTTSLMDIPSGISFCILIPTRVVREVGLMDPVFGRGYCEEVDWTLRSRALGYRVTLAPGVFVYHSGGGTNREAGLLLTDQTTVPAHEAILDMRYPQFRDQVAAFETSGILAGACMDAEEILISRAARQFGYSVEVGWLPRGKTTAAVQCVVAPEGTATVRARYRGFEASFTLQEGQDAGELLRERMGSDPVQVNLYDRGSVSARMAAVGGTVIDHYSYPRRV